MTDMIETTLYGKRVRFPAIYLKDLKAKEAAVNASLATKDPEAQRKLAAKIIRINRKVPPCVQFL